MRSKGLKRYYFYVVVILQSFSTRCSGNVDCGLEGAGASNVVEEETGLAEGDRRPWAVEIAWKKVKFMAKS